MRTFSPKMQHVYEVSVDDAPGTVAGGDSVLSPAHPCSFTVRGVGVFLSPYQAALMSHMFDVSAGDLHKAQSLGNAGTASTSGKHHKKCVDDVMGKKRGSKGPDMSVQEEVRFLEPLYLMRCVQVPEIGRTLLNTRGRIAFSASEPRGAGRALTCCEFRSDDWGTTKNLYGCMLERCRQALRDALPEDTPMVQPLCMALPPRPAPRKRRRRATSPA